MYSVSGAGIQGTIIIKFHDPRPFFKKMMEETTDNNSKEIYKDFVEDSEENSLSVSWVRWIPDAPFPVDG